MLGGRSCRTEVAARGRFHIGVGFARAVGVRLVRMETHVPRSAPASADVEEMGVDL